MTNSSSMRAMLAQAALEYVPPLVRQTLLDDGSIHEEFGLKKEAVTTLGTPGVDIQRTVLFDAVRSVLAGSGNTEIVDKAGRTWQLGNEADEGVLPVLVLSADDERMMLPDFAVLSDDAGTRLRSLERAVVAVNLPIDAKERWNEILTERALEDDELGMFHNDIRNTPGHLALTIRSGIDAGQSSISSLVPGSRDYYDRLIGAYDGCASVKDYAAGPGRALLHNLSRSRPYEGFLCSLFLSSHSALTAEICTDHLDNETLVKAFECVEAHGDMLSRLGAFEVGLRIRSLRPEIEPFLLRLVLRIRDDDLESDQSDFRIFSSLFMLVDGELSRIRLMSDTPPFYRRLASLAHAALIHREIVQSGIEYKSFYEWAFGARFEYYYLQSLADLRIEPRWIPDLTDESLLKEYFFGRLMIAGQNYSEILGVGELRETVLGDGKHSLAKLSSLLGPEYPGPLEGAEECPNQLPEDLARAIDEQLNADKVNVSSYMALINSAMIFKITSSHAELAAKALRSGNYTLANLKDESQLVGILYGLATVAAVSRSSALADELRILVRRYLHDPLYQFTVIEAMSICLVASASRQNLVDWREFAGQWLTELAFSDMDGKVADGFCSYLTTLLDLTPELWISCARADAAIQAKALC